MRELPMDNKENINQEKIDGRTKLYKETVSRLEHNRRPVSYTHLTLPTKA